MNRNEIREQDTWDLTLLFKTTADWEQTLHSAETALNAFQPVMEHMLDSAQALYDCCTALTALSEQIDRVYTYAHLKFSEDTANNEARVLMGRAENLVTAFSEAFSPFDTILLTLEAGQLDAFFRECPALEQEFGIMLRNTFRYKPHTLSKTEEQLLAAFSKERSTAENTYETLTSSDLKFGTIKVVANAELDKEYAKEREAAAAIAAEEAKEESGIAQPAVPATGTAAAMSNTTAASPVASAVPAGSAAASSGIAAATMDDAEVAAALDRVSSAAKTGTTVRKEDFSYFLPVNIVFGPGKVKQVGTLASPYGKKALIVTGRPRERQSEGGRHRDCAVRQGQPESAHHDGN